MHARSPIPAVVAVVALLAASAGPLVGPARAAGGIDRYVATTGTDTGDCSVEATPCRTIQYAVDHVAGNSDTIHVAAGTYTESVAWSRASIIGAGQGETIVNARLNYAFEFMSQGVLGSLSVGCPGGCEGGSAVNSEDTLLIDDVEFLPSAARGFVGLDYDLGSYTIRRSTFRGALGVATGGGTITGSTFETSRLAVQQGIGFNLTRPLLVSESRFPASGIAVDRDGEPVLGMGEYFPIELRDDWWGCNGGPGAAGCSRLGTSQGLSMSAVPSWLQLRAIDAPATLQPGATVELRFGLVGSATKAVAKDFPPTAIGFSADVGTLGAVSGSTVDGVATVAYTAPAEPGVYRIRATLDSGTAEVVLNAPGAPSPSPSASPRSVTPPPTSTIEPSRPRAPGLPLVVGLLAMLGVVLTTMIGVRRTRRPR